MIRVPRREHLSSIHATGSRHLMLLSAMALALAACSSDDDPAPPNDDVTPPSANDIQIVTASNRADLVSGGDVLVELVLPGGDATGLAVDVDGRDITSAFKTVGTRPTGLIDGLAVGSNTITASTAAGGTASITVINAARGGPILSGAQVTPYYCATPVPELASGERPATNASGLSAAATDAQCNIPTEYKIYYKSNAANCTLALPDPSPAVSPTATTQPDAAALPENPCFKPYDAQAAAPDDMDTVPGTAQPFIVRVERGTMNRGIYDIATLFDPTAPWTATEPQAQWSGKVLYQFGASTGQPRRQARPAGTWTNLPALATGYMVVANSMTDSARNSNRVSMAETVMMMKEHITEQYGKIRFTLGTGCSGGSINSNGNASIAPGQLDGIVIFCTYPDSETTGIEVGDCTLLSEAYQKNEWLNLAQSSGLTQEALNAKKAAINGHPDQTGCHGWMNAFGSNAKAGSYNQRVVADNATGAIATLPAVVNNCELPESAVYAPGSNENGARCNAPSWAESIWGRVDGTVFGKATADNVGVQYGLQALRDGVITTEEFVTLNEVIGGTDRNYNFQAARSSADADALAIAYRSGIVSSGKNLAKLPIIDLRGWDDSALVMAPGTGAAPLFPIHFVWRSFSLRERLDKEFGDHDNHVMWRFGRGGLLPSPSLQLEAVNVMDEWLTALVALKASDAATDGSSSLTIEQAVRQSRPSDKAYDFCLLSTDEAQSNRVTDMTVCDADPFLKAGSSPRRVAGGPLAANILKCQLKAIDVSDYGTATLAGDQFARLEAVFPQGVCDWSKPGVGQVDPESRLTFAAGPGGVPLPTAPVSQVK